MKTEQQVQTNRLIPVTRWNDYYPFPTIGSLRALVFNASKNGFNKVIRKIGGRIVLDERQFFLWVEETGKVS